MGKLKELELRFIGLALVAVFLSCSAHAQSDEGIPLRETMLSAYPYAFYTPETELAFGAGGIVTLYTGRDLILNPSKIGLSAYYTTNKQYQVT